MNRREVIKDAALGAAMLVVAGAGGVIGGTYADQEKRRRIRNEALRFENETTILRVQIEELGTKTDIERLTRAQDVLSATGDSLYKTDLELYWRVFSADLQGAGPAYGHHVPKFWEEFVNSVGGRTNPAGEAVAQLSDRINQWAAHFGRLGDTDEREDRLERLLNLHWGEIDYRNYNAKLLFEFEQVQLERDIGLFLLAIRGFAGKEKDRLVRSANQGVDQWINESQDVLNQLGGVNFDEVNESAKNSNPFI